MTRDIPPGGLEQRSATTPTVRVAPATVGHKAASLKLRLKERVTRRVLTQTPPRGGRDARKLASAPSRAGQQRQGRYLGLSRYVTTN